MKRLFLTLLCVIVLSGMVFSQNQESDQIKATATLVGDISVIGERDLNFGNIWGGTGNTGWPNTTVNLDETQNEGDQSTGWFRIEAGLGNPNITVQIDFPEYLIHNDDDTNHLSLGDFKWRVKDSEDTQIDDYITSPGNIGSEDFNMASDSANNDRILDIFIGGEVIPDGDNIAGSYENDIILTVEYN